MRSKARRKHLKKVPLTEYPAFPDRLKYAMTVRDCSNKRLAERLFVAHSTISGYCAGARCPSIDCLTRIAQELDVSTDFLLGLDEYIDI